MYLLIRADGARSPNGTNNLHPTMYLLILSSHVTGLKPASSFTSHYVSINSRRQPQSRII